MADASLFEETFTIGSINAQKYDRVSRIASTGASGDTSMTLDVNTELYPLATGDVVHLLLASTLATDGTKDEGKGWRDVSKGEPTLADHYEYVCHGKIYRFEEGVGEMIKVFISFGGMLLYLEGPYKKLTPLRIDYVYLLMRKT